MIIGHSRRLSFRLNHSWVKADPNFIFFTSGLPGRRPVTHRACGARRRTIHPLHRAPRDRHLCPTRVGPLPFVKHALQAIARCPCRQCGGPRAVSQPHDVVEIGNFAPFSEFLHIKGRHFPNFFPFKSTHDPYEPWKSFMEDTQTDRQTRQLYIYRKPIFAKWSTNTSMQLMVRYSHRMRCVAVPRGMLCRLHRNIPQYAARRCNTTHRIRCEQTLSLFQCFDTVVLLL